MNAAQLSIFGPSPEKGTGHVQGCLGVLLRAESSIARTKGLVLDLAVRGMLLPQFHTDEPASHLLAKIKRQKDFAAAKGVRNDSDDTDPQFALPSSWEWTTLGEICEYIQRGKSPTYAETSEIPVVSQKCVQWEGFVLDRARFIDTKTVNTYGAERFLRGGDLLWNSTGHGTVGRVAIFVPTNKYSCYVADSHVTVIRPLLVEPRWIWCWLASPTVQKTIDDLVSGTTKQTELATSTVVLHPIPLPPLAEQKRIVAKVDQLMDLCDELDGKQTKKREIGERLTKASLGALTSAEGPDELKVAWKRLAENFEELIDRPEKVTELRATIRELGIRGILVPSNGNDDARQLIAQICSRRLQLERAGTIRKSNPLPAIDAKPFPLPPGWTWTRLGELCFQVADGPHFSPKYVSAKEGVPFLSARNIRANCISLSDAKYVSRSDHETFCQRVRPERGDILYTKGGTTGIAVVNNLDVEFSVWVHVAVLKIARTYLSPEYVALALNSRHCYEQSQMYTHGTGNRDLGLTRMVLITLPIPPRAVQDQVVAKVNGLIKVCDELEAKLRTRDEKAAKLAEALVAEVVGT